jgi:hypothetical protein
VCRVCESFIAFTNRTTEETATDPADPAGRRSPFATTARRTPLVAGYSNAARERWKERRCTSQLLFCCSSQRSAACQL